MYLQRLALHNFRIYENLVLELEAGVVLLVGPNAAGKTSFLEAVHVAATTKSPRTTSDRELIRWDTDGARVEGEFCKRSDERVRLAVVLDNTGGNGLRKRLSVNGTPVDSARSVVGRVKVVMFGPEDLSVIKAGPGARRRFLNTALAQLLPRYLDDHQRYVRALRQRNEVLRAVRDGSADRAAVAPWTEQLVTSGAALAMDRAAYVAALDTEAHRLHAEISGGEALALRYRGDLAEAQELSEAREKYLALFARRAETEVMRGTTLCGPHLDDIDVRVNDVCVRRFGSQGQQRTAALSMKLCQVRVARTWDDEPPLVLLDDCLSELDDNRARHVLELVGDLDGLMISSATMTRPLAQLPRAAVYNVGGGRIAGT